MSEQQTQQADDPSGEGWRDVGPDEILQVGDMFWVVDHWETTKNVGGKSSMYGIGYRRRIEPQQPSDSEPETMEMREQVRDLTRQAQFDAVELQQLREQVATLTQELKDKSDSYQMCLQSHYKAGQRSAIDRLQAWLRPVLELLADDPEDASPLAVAVLSYLPGIASQLIEE